jgi:hypothetical protein
MMPASRTAGRIWLFRRTLPPGHGLAQDEFDLRIHTAQIVRRPFFQLLQEIRREPEEKGFALFRCHDQV